MPGNKTLLVPLAAAVIALGFSAVSAQGPVVRLMAGAGFTLVNFDAVMDDTDATLEDWDQFNYSFALQGFWKISPKVRIGGEAGWERLYYYYYRAPYGYTTTFHEADWTTIFVGGLAQYFLAGSFYLLAGVDVHMFSGDGTAIGISGGVGAEIRLNDRLSLPLELRFKPVMGTGTPTVIQFNIGAAFTPGR